MIKSSNTLTALAFGVTLICAALSPSYADNIDIESDKFGQKVREYLLANPEVILEAMELLGTKQAADKQAELVAPHYTKLIAADSDLVIGNPDASIKVIEFFDYRCAVCKAVVPVLEEFVSDNPDIVFIKKHLAILTPASERATRYVLAANLVYGPQTYQKLHKALYATRRPMTEKTFKDIAENLDLDHASISEKLNDETITQTIDLHRDIAIELEFKGTPVFMGPKSFKAGRIDSNDLEELTQDG